MRGAWVLFALVLGLAGCSLTDGDGGAAIEGNVLSVLVLQPDDLGRGYVLFDEGRQGLADRRGGSDRDRFGRKDGWRARYRRPSSAGTRGPLVIESRVDLFDSASGAEDEFDAVREEVETTGLRSGAEIVEPPRLGDEAFVVTYGLGTVQYFTVLWREENATAMLNVNGLQGRVVLAQVLRLAGKQQARLARAAR
jgi:hypothetical protein